MKFKLRRPALRLLFSVGLAVSFVGIVLTFSIQQATIELLSQPCQDYLYGERFARTELLFGLSKPNRSVVTETEFQRFIDREVTPLFPDGLTLVDAAGQFKDSDAVVKEGSKLLLLLYPFNSESFRNIEQIREVYKSTFQQRSVLRVDHASCVSF